MDITRMHEMIEKISECAKCECENGIENVDTCEMGKVTDMLKDLSEAMYYRVLTNTMLESDAEEVLDMFDRYGEDRRYYDHYRYKNGRFAPKGKGTYRRGYEEPPYYFMNPEMYKEHSPEWYRDMDREHGKMYYTETMPMRDAKEGKSGMSRRAYVESREMHKGNTPEDKQKKMHDLEVYTKELAEDVTELITDMTAEEKALLKNKMQILIQKIN